MSIGIVNKYETERKVKIHWKICNFLPLLNRSWSNSSPCISWSSINWKFIIQYVSEQNIIYLHLSKDASEKPIAVVFKLGIKLKDGATEMRSTLIKNFDTSRCDFGTENFILKEELLERKHELLTEGSLIVTCCIAHLNDVTNPQNIKYERLDVLSTNFKALYGCINTSDMTIVIGEKRFPVHKLILAARSNVFAAMLRQNMTESNSGIMSITDFDPTSFNDFLLYLYTGKVENISACNVCELYRIADKYNVQELKVLCTRYMKRNFSINNFFDIVILANHFNDTELISVTEECFKNNHEQILKTELWGEFFHQNETLANQLLIGAFKKLN